MCVSGHRQTQGHRQTHQHTGGGWRRRQEVSMKAPREGIGSTKNKGAEKEMSRPKVAGAG